MQFEFYKTQLNNYLFLCFSQYLEVTFKIFICWKNSHRQVKWISPQCCALPKFILEGLGLGGKGFS